MKVRGALYIPTYEYNYKVITGCRTILQEYYITNRRKCEDTKRNTIMNSTKSAHELHKENSRDKRGTPGRIGPHTDLLLIHKVAATNSDQ